jgi:hypothetical protein
MLDLPIAFPPKTSRTQQAYPFPSARLLYQGREAPPVPASQATMGLKSFGWYALAMRVRGGRIGFDVQAIA